MASLRVTLLVSLHTALLAYVLFLRAFIVSFVHNSALLLRCVSSQNNHGWRCSESETAPVKVALAILNTVFPVCLLLWLLSSRPNCTKAWYQRWCCSFDHILPAGATSQMQLLSAVAATVMMEGAAMSGTLGAGSVGLMATEAVLLVEIVVLVALPWFPLSRVLKAHIILRSALLVNVHLLFMIPDEKRLPLSLLPMTMGLLIIAFLEVRCCHCIPFLLQHPVASGQRLKQSFEDLPRMALRLAAADATECWACCGSFSQDERICLELAARAVCQRLDNKPLAALATSAYIQSVLSTGNCESSAEGLQRSFSNASMESSGLVSATSRNELKAAQSQQSDRVGRDGPGMSQLQADCKFRTNRSQSESASQQPHAFSVKKQERPSRERLAHETPRHVPEASVVGTSSVAGEEASRRWLLEQGAGSRILAHRYKRKDETQHMLSSKARAPPRPLDPISSHMYGLVEPGLESKFSDEKQELSSIVS